MLKGCKATWSDEFITVAFASVDAFAKEYDSNLKSGGIFVNIDSPPQLHDNVKLMLVVEAEKIEVVGRVVWSNPQGAGIQLDPLTPDVINRVQSILGNEPDQAGQPPASSEQPKVQGAKFSNQVTPANLFADKPIWSADSLFAVISALGSKQFNGFLNVRGNDIADRFRLEFCQGKVSFPSNFLDSRDVGPMLKKFKAVSNIQLQKATSYSQEKDITMRKALVELGLVGEEVITRLIRVKLVQRSAKVFALTSGSYSLAPAEEPSTQPGILAIDAKSLLYSGLMLAIKPPFDSAVSQKMETLMPSYLKAIDNVVDCNDSELKLWELILAGSKTLRAVLASSPFSRQETFRTLVAMQGAGLIAFTKTASAETKEENQDVVDLYKIMQTGNDFTRLAIHWSHPPSKIDEAYHRRRKELEKFAGMGVSASELNAINEMKKWIEASYKLLSDNKKRREYRLQLVSEEQCKNSARILFQKAQLSIFRHNYQDAYDMLEACVELDPRNSNFVKVFEKIERLKK
jgi:hypothetical protein